MKELLYEMNLAMTNEKERANKKFPPFVSSHHAYGVIKEEHEEAESDFTSIKNQFDDYWIAVKQNDYVTQKQCLECMRDVALHCAAETIQFSAMAQKALDSMENYRKD